MLGDRSEPKSNAAIGFLRIMSGPNDCRIPTFAGMTTLDVFGRRECVDRKADFDEWP